MGAAVFVEAGGASKYVHARIVGKLPPGKLSFTVTPQDLCAVTASPDGRSLIVSASAEANAAFGSIGMTWTPDGGAPALTATVPVAVVDPSDGSLDWFVS